jgi:2-oxoglutarate ferredoxin oxidoreductase subunit alpha
MAQTKIFNWEIGGPAGAGQQVAGIIFAKACMRSGLYVCDMSEYPSRIRGGIVTFQVSLSNQPISAVYEPTHLLIALSAEAFGYCQKDVVRAGLILFDKDKFTPEAKYARGRKLHGVSLKTLTQQAGVPTIAGNMIMLGIAVRLMSHNLAMIEKVVREMFGGKGSDVAESNVKAITFGYHYAQENLDPKHYPYQFDHGQVGHQRILMTGNEMVALGAVAAGCQYYVAYPMTPATSILHNLTNWADRTGMLVVQPEDEIAAVHHAIGASYAGVRAMVATSGGGYALMNEGVSLAAMTETPLTIVESQRPGPATGLPTWTEQSDLQYLVHSGHGEFVRAVLAPGDQAEAFAHTALALNLAEKYQIPTFVMVDKYLSEGHQAIEAPNLNVPIERGQILTTAQLAKIKTYYRYQIKADGVSARALPGQPGGVHLTNSDEHDEAGFTIEGFASDSRLAQVNKRQAKLKSLLKELPKPKWYGSAKAKVTLIGWGSVKGSVLEALKSLPHVNYLHVQAPWPLDEKVYARLLKGVRFLVAVENNVTGQFAKLLRQETGVTVTNKVLKYNGSQFYPHEIVERVTKIIRASRG